MDPIHGNPLLPSPVLRRIVASTALPTELAREVERYLVPPPPDALRHAPAQPAQISRYVDRLLKIAAPLRPPIALVGSRGERGPTYRAWIVERAGAQVTVALRLEDRGVRAALGEEAIAGERHFAFDLDAGHLDLRIDLRDLSAESMAAYNRVLQGELPPRDRPRPRW
ncbi:hypothetical protein [Ramlibacter sp.]|uniref:hypothetical protein n=1 Tax=Ramlibacter sp. TaxID=1917967 RepID=UPI003D0EE5A3